MKKKISLIIAYSVLGLVVVGLILCSIIKINFMPEMKVPVTTDIGKIQITTSSGTSAVDSSNENINMNKFSETFSNSFKLTILYSVFSGKIGNEVQIKKQTTSPTFSGYKVQFIYQESQTLKKGGKPVTVADNSNTEVTYNRAVFDVKEGKGLTNVNIYFYTNGESNYYQLTTIANFDELYTFIKALPMFGE